MKQLDIRPLSDDLPFGARVAGVTWETLADEVMRQKLREIFEDRGVIVFEEMERSGDLQLELSEVFGPLQQHAIKNMVKVEGAQKPGLVSIGATPTNANIMAIHGKPRASYVPWHFDACYTKKLNRAGVLRMVVMPPEDGRTGFVDGIQTYNALPAEWRKRAEDLEIIYFQGNMHHRQRFGVADGWSLVRYADYTAKIFAESESLPRSIHPAVWQRKTGEKVLHVSPWQADGIVGHESAEGDALLEELIQQMYKAMKPYWHEWSPADMVIWDNWRFLHACEGHDPREPRDPHRSTIEGDYGLGRFEPMEERPARCDSCTV